MMHWLCLPTSSWTCCMLTSLLATQTCVKWVTTGIPLLVLIKEIVGMVLTHPPYRMAWDTPNTALVNVTTVLRNRACTDVWLKPFLCVGDIWYISRDVPDAQGPSVGLVIQCDASLQLLCETAGPPSTETSSEQNGPQAGQLAADISFAMSCTVSTCLCPHTIYFESLNPLHWIHVWGHLLLRLPITECQLESVPVVCVWLRPVPHPPIVWLQSARRPPDHFCTGTHPTMLQWHGETTIRNWHKSISKKTGHYPYSPKA